jgi:hypothetical protein
MSETNTQSSVSSEQSSIKSPPSSIGENVAKSMTPRNVKILAGLFLVICVLDINTVYDSIDTMDSSTLKGIKYTRIGIDSIIILMSLIFIVKPEKLQDKRLFWSYVAIIVLQLIILIMQQNSEN